MFTCVPFVLQPLRIHISEECRKCLKNSDFMIEYRGVVILKVSWNTRVDQVYTFADYATNFCYRIFPESIVFREFLFLELCIFVIFPFSVLFKYFHLNCV